MSNWHRSHKTGKCIEVHESILVCHVASDINGQRARYTVAPPGGDYRTFRLYVALEEDRGPSEEIRIGDDAFGFAFPGSRKTYAG